MEEDTSPEFERICDVISQGENILFSGCGGTGKSYMLKRISAFAISKGIRTFCTATTGVASISLSLPEKGIFASTVHSWAGIGIGDFPAAKLAACVKNHDKARKRWLSTSLLIIDEISMFGRNLFEKLDYVGRQVRQVYDKPFGGIQLIVSGDFLQLPPVKDEWIFTSKVWEECNFTPIIFDIPKRFNDIPYFHLLLRVRKSEHTREDLKLLESKVVEYQKWLDTPRSDLEVKPTIVYSKKVDVEAYNEDQLERLSGELRTFIGTDTYKANTSTAKYEDYIRRLDDHIPKAVRLKVGAQVMLKINLDIAAGLVNGSRGVVTTMHSSSITVKFLSGKTIIIDLFAFVSEDNDAKAMRTQIPVILAWASSIHRTQGLTLDYVICDLGPSVFCCGQAYVALSRVRNLKGLLLSDFYPSGIKTDQIALEYIRLLEKSATQRNYGVDSLVEPKEPIQKMGVTMVFYDEDGNEEERVDT